jgi:hypothetical protein
VNFVPPVNPAGIQSQRHRWQAPAEGPAPLPFRFGFNPQFQQFNVQQQQQAALHQAALRRGGSGRHHVIKQRSVSMDSFDYPQQVPDERLAQGPLRRPLPSAGFVHQPPRSNGPPPFVLQPFRIQRV